MKTKLYLTLAAVCAICAAPAMAVQKCVYLTSATTCGTATAANQYDWSVACTTSGRSVDISGMAACAPSNNHTTSLAAVLSTNGSGHYHCWCKMTSPAVSYWIYSTNLSTETNCRASCASRCLQSLATTSSFRNSMFEYMED